MPSLRNKLSLKKAQKRTSFLGYLFLLALLLFLPLAELQCQNMYPAITLGGSIYPRRNVKDEDGTYGRKLAYVRIGVPVLKNIKLKDDGLRLYLLSINANASTDNTQLSFLHLSRTFYTGNLSVNGIYKSSGKSIWFTKATASSFEDDITIQNPSLRVSGFALYRRSVRESFFYMVGGAYSFVYGAGLPLPVLGIGWKFTNHASLTAILPFNISYHFGRRGNPWSVFVKPNGGVSNFYNNTFFSHEGETIIFRRREFVLGVKRRIQLSDQWSITAEAGFVAARRIFFSKDFTRTENSIISEFNVKGGPYISVGLRFKFKKDKPVATDASPVIQEDQFDVDSILPNY